MKCPHCKKEVPEPKEWFLPNLIFPTFLFVIISGWLLPFDIEHGYDKEYDMIIALFFIIVYIGYLILYRYDKVKGRFVLIKKEVTYV